MALSQEKKSVIMSSLDKEKNMLSANLDTWKQKLRQFEQANNISTKTFVKQFESGKLGDDKKWFEWSMAHKAYVHLKEKLDLVKSINL